MFQKFSLNAIEKGKGDVDSGGKDLLLVNQNENYVKRENRKHFGRWSIQQSGDQLSVLVYTECTTFGM